MVVAQAISGSIPELATRTLQIRCVPTRKRMETEMAKMTSNMRRIRKGDTFVVNGKLVTVQGFPEKLDNGKVKVPVLVEGSTRPSRRTFDGDLRVNLV